MKLTLIFAVISFAIFMSFAVEESDAQLGRLIFNIGRKIGGSGKPRQHFKNHANKKAAEDAARNAGKGNPPVHHTPHKPGQQPHFHPADRNGNIVKDGSHHQYPNKQG